MGWRLLSPRGLGYGDSHAQQRLRTGQSWQCQPTHGGKTPVSMAARVAGGPVAVELGLPRRRQHVEAEPEVGLVSEAVRGRRVAIDRELWIESWSEASTWRSEYFRAAVLGVDHAEAAVGRALDEVERADQVPVENLARRLVDERYGKNVEGR
jgi:hypothetical protein